MTIPESSVANNNHKTKTLMDTSKKGSSKETETEEADTHKEETEVIQEEVPREKKEQMTEIWIVSSETIG